MRVAQVCPYDLAAPGGVQAQVVGLARALARSGHQVCVIAPVQPASLRSVAAEIPAVINDPGDGASALTTPEVLHLVPVGASVRVPANGSRAPVAPFPWVARRTLAALASGSFDVVHVHEPMVPGPALAATARATGPVVGTFHRSGRGAVYSAAGPLLRHWSRRLARRCAVSAEAAGTAHAVLGGDFEVLFNGVELGVFAPGERGRRGDDGPLTVVFVGRHEGRKGLSVLLDAVAMAPAPMVLWVMGEGPLTRSLRRRPTNGRRVEWLGRVSESEKIGRLRRADVLCAPSLGGESFGAVLLEAMAAGAVPVASDLPGYRAVARDGIEALLVPPGDAGALAAGLGRLAGEPGLRSALAAAGSARAAAMSMERLARAYELVYAGARQPAEGGGNSACPRRGRP